MKVCELFTSIQGEIQGLGRFCFFIRFFGCNLGSSCTIECDTPYSWQKEHEKNATDYSIAQLSKKIQESGCTAVVITGGEPLLYQDEIRSLITSVRNITPKIDKVFIETNGTILPKKWLFNDEMVRFNVSPKLEGFNPAKFPAPDRSIFKYIASGDNNELDMLLDKISNFPPLLRDRIYIMPKSKNRGEYLKNAPLVAKWCVKNKINFGPRLHLLLWDGKKGT